MSDVICGAPSHWRGIVCQSSPHDGDRHQAEDDRSVYTWTTASVEAERRGECPGCLRSICVCPCNCPDCSRRKAESRP